MSNEETVVPQAVRYLSPKQYYSQEQQKIRPYLLQQHKSELKVKTIQYTQRPEIPDLGQAQ